MSMAKRFRPEIEEPRLRALWDEVGVYRFEPSDSSGPVYAIDTPPATVSGNLHLGHCYSYSHTDIIARYRRMRGDRVFYPMGYDDNGLPTERLVERRLGLRADDVGRAAFVEACEEESLRAAADYESLWKRLGLSVDWRHTYRTIAADSRRLAQWSFLDLARRGRLYRAEAPTLWCPECRTAIAQAEQADLERETTFHDLVFRLDDGARLPISTTRPELLPACVAVFVHPADARHASLAGGSAVVPLFERSVPVLKDPMVDPDKGSGAVMCCTFGDATDVAWWRAHDLPIVNAMSADGTLSEEAGPRYAGLSVIDARRAIVADLEARGEITGAHRVAQSVRVHERCDTPVEFLVRANWFVRVLDRRDELLAAADDIAWRPPQMAERYREWVSGLGWDWCVSRQRAYGVPVPAWTCRDCGEAVLADEAQLPVDPIVDRPPRPCECGGTRLEPEKDVLDTWATSSLTPQIAARWPNDPGLWSRVFPYALRPQAHEIIRTWTFYTIVKSAYHFGQRPWSEVMISGWGIAPDGGGKISKSRGGGPLAPDEALDRYGADAVRFWAASTGLGKDAVISEAKIQAGAKLVTKLWNVARFADAVLARGEGASAPLSQAERDGQSAHRHAARDESSPDPHGDASTPDRRAERDAQSPWALVASGLALSPADRWILARGGSAVARATRMLDALDYAGAKAEIEAFFWHDLADNYIEMAKGRLYADDGAPRDAARATLQAVVLLSLKLFAPFLPYVTDAAFRSLFARGDDAASIHATSWPEGSPKEYDDGDERLGDTLVAVAAAVRRYKSERSLPLGAELAEITIAAGDRGLRTGLLRAEADLRSVTRARDVLVTDRLATGAIALPCDASVEVGLLE